VEVFLSSPRSLVEVFLSSPRLLVDVFLSSPRLLVEVFLSFMEDDFSFSFTLSSSTGDLLCALLLLGGFVLDSLTGGTSDQYTKRATTANGKIPSLSFANIEISHVFGGLAKNGNYSSISFNGKVRFILK